MVKCGFEVKQDGGERSVGLMTLARAISVE